MMKFANVICDHMDLIMHTAFTGGGSKNDRREMIESLKDQAMNLITGAELSGGICAAKAESYRDAIMDEYYDLMTYLE